MVRHETMHYKVQIWTKFFSLLGPKLLLTAEENLQPLQVFTSKEAIRPLPWIGHCFFCSL